MLKKYHKQQQSLGSPLAIRVFYEVPKRCLKVPKRFLMYGDEWGKEVPKRCLKVPKRCLMYGDEWGKEVPKRCLRGA